MLRGFRVVEDMIEGLESYMRDKGFATLDQMIGKAIPQYSEWGNLDLNHEPVAKINADKCIGCQLGVVACHDGAHQCVHPQAGTRVPHVDESECVGCNLCQIVCPVPGCITMETVANGYAPATWNEHVELGKALRPKKASH
jgi:dihydropyrimidine dehydrogenase (NAD+) subunit PreA